jgi:hypothetical protein
MGQPVVHAGIAVAIAVCLAGCAGGTPPGDDDGDDDAIDAATGDGGGTPVDAAADPLTLSQNTAETITVGNSVRCSTGAVSYYRTFNLAVYTSMSFHATAINLGVEAVTGSPQITLRLHTLVGSMSTNNMTLLYEQSNPVAMQGAVVTIPLVDDVYVSGGSLLVVEVAIPDDDVFLIGSNAAGQSAPSWVKWPGCGEAQPVTLESRGEPDVHIVLTVDGTSP